MAASSRRKQVVDSETQADETRLADEFLQLARLSTQGRSQDVAMHLRRSTRRLATSNPELAQRLRDLLAHSSGAVEPVRRASSISSPGASDQVAQLVQIEAPVLEDCSMILSEDTELEIAQILAEHQDPDRLAQAGLVPTKAVLMTGPPGVGKTLAARRIAAHLGVRLVVLDLSAVMGSMLGQTGANLREVFEFACSERCVLLLDEIDAVAKKRNDHLDIGELKRLVTVLLQQLDNWPDDAGLIVGATNHPELLDPAAWRRFDTVIDFPLPNEAARRQAIEMYANADLPPSDQALVAAATEGFSFSDVERLVTNARRRTALQDVELADGLIELTGRHLRSLPLDRRRSTGVELARRRLASQRRVSELTGLSRDTIRKHTKDGANG